MNIRSRLVLFVFYDPYGNVDDYVMTLLRSLRPACQRLVVICNGKLGQEGRKHLGSVADDIYKRTNNGFDALAFKECMINYLGWEEVRKYDEVVLMNDTVYGPVNDTYQHIFRIMDEKNVDFWGISCGYKQLDGFGVFKSGYMPEHIQSFFIAVRKAVLSDTAFIKFWNDYQPAADRVSDVITSYEVIFTKYLKDHGFQYTIYADTEIYNSIYPRENYNLYGYSSSELIKYHNFPFIKRKILNIDPTEYLTFSDLHDGADALEYAHRESSYDIAQIWQNLLHRYNTMSLYYSLHLDYILPSSDIEGAPARSAALVYYNSNQACTEAMLRSAVNNAASIDVYMILNLDDTTAIDLKTPSMAGVHFLKPTDIHSPMAGFVLCCKELCEQYTYIGFLHDENNDGHDPRPIFDSIVYNYITNIAFDKLYISSVLSVFEENPALGVLAAPMPIHHKYISNLSNAWGNWYTETENLVRQLSLTCHIDKSIPPLMVSGSFWCRTTSIKSLWAQDWNDNKFQKSRLSYTSPVNEALKRILPFVAQSEGYYSGIVMNTVYASIRLASTDYMLRLYMNGKGMPFSSCGGLQGSYNEERSYITEDENRNKIIYRDLGVRGALGIYIKKNLPEKIACFLVNTFRLY